MSMDLNTGDIVLFSGKGIFSLGIKWITRCKWSHVGMIVMIDNVAHILESTTMCNVNDIYLNKPISGVQVVPYAERVAAYDGEVGVCQLMWDNEYDLVQANEHVEEFIKLHHGKAYEKDKFELLKSAVDCIGDDNVEDVSTLFCSELVIEAWEAMGVLAEGDLISNEITPSDFVVQPHFSVHDSINHIGNNVTLSTIVRTVKKG